MNIKPFANTGNFTAFDNAILDYILPECAPNTWKIVSVTIRKTRGWHKEEDWISISQYMKLTGIKNRTTCHNAIQDALSKGYLIRRPYRTQSFKYGLNKEYEIRTSTETVPVTSTENVLVPSTESVLTKETITKETIAKENNNKFTNAIKIKMVSTLSQVTGMDESLNYGRLARDAKALHNAGYSATDISKAFGKKSIWYKKHWKGRKGDKPTTGDIRSLIKELMHTEHCGCDACRRKYVDGEFSDFIE